MRACVRACLCVCVCVCVAKPVTVELRCHAIALILVIGKAQFRRAMLSCDSSCFVSKQNSPRRDAAKGRRLAASHQGLFYLHMSHKKTPGSYGFNYVAF